MKGSVSCMNKKYIIPFFCLGLFITGCNFTPPLELPPVDTPMSYSDLNGGSKLEVGVTPSNKPIHEYWWEDFNDETLNLLIEESLRNNTDYALAVSKVMQMRMALNMTNAEIYPNIQGDLSANKVINGTSMNPSYSLSATLSYEIDLWGRVKESSRAAVATLLATAASQESVRLSLIAGVADSYFALLNLEEQKKILESTVKTYEETYQYRLKQYNAGGLEEITLEQSKVQLESAKADLFSTLRRRSEAMSALSLLLGRAPRGIFAAEFLFGELLPKAPTVPLGLPSTLIQNRPDIKMAEENLRSANHSIGVAQASYFPVLSLSALAGLSSNQLGTLFDNSLMSVGANMAGTVFDFGRTEYKVKSAEALKEQALITYRATIAKAFSEVRDALVARENSQKRLQAIEAQARSQERVYEIAKHRFEAGYTSHLELLDAERNWLSVQLTLSSAKADVLSSSLSLYKALGGGFSARDLERETLYERP